MISVIIPKYASSEHETRCFNSIIRQTYKDSEILVIGGDLSQSDREKYNIRNLECKNNEDFCSALNKAIDSADGKYIFFMDIDMVISAGFFETLISASESEDGFIFACGHEYNFDSAGAREKDTVSLLSCFGKLFIKDILKDNNIRFEGNDCFSEFLFTAEYICKFKEIVHTDCSIYENNEVFSSRIIYENEKWKTLFKNIKNTSGNIQADITKSLANLIKKTGCCTEEVMTLAEYELHDSYELNFECSAQILKRLWEETCDSKNSETFNKLRTYLKKYEDEPLLPLIMNYLGLEADSYEYFRTDNIENILFLCRKAGELKKESCTSAAESEKNPAEISIYEESISYYRSGRLGLKAILKSLTAWFKYKTERGKQSK